MSTQAIPLLSLDAPEMPLSDYRSLREGRELPAKLDISSPAAADAATPTPEVETAVESETAGTSSEVVKAESKQAKPDKLNARFSELTSKIKDLQTQLAAKTGGIGQTDTPKVDAALTLPPDPKDPEPEVSKFTDYADYLRAVGRWDRRQEKRAETVASQAAAVQTVAVERAKVWSDKVSAAKAEYADFEAVAQNPDLPISQAMADAITDSEMGTQLLYKLGQSPAEAARIAKLSPVAQIREIGKLEASLLKESAAAGDDSAETLPEKTIPVSKAPAPHRPVSGSAASSNPLTKLDSMTQAEYRALRDSGKIR